MEMIFLNYQVGRAHPTQEHQILRKKPIIKKLTIILITLDHNHLIIIKMATVQDNPSNVIALEKHETKLIHF